MTPDTARGSRCPAESHSQRQESVSRVRVRPPSPKCHGGAKGHREQSPHSPVCYQPLRVSRAKGTVRKRKENLGVGGDPCGTVQPPPPTQSSSPTRDSTGRGRRLPPAHGEGQRCFAGVGNLHETPPHHPKDPPGWSWVVGGEMERPPPSLSPGSPIAPARARSSFWMGLLTGMGGGGGERGTGWGGDVGAPWAGVPVSGPPPHRGGRKQSCPAFPEDEDFLPPIEWGP